MVHCSTQREQHFFPLLVSVVKTPHLVSGLVEEDVARLRVLGDFRSEAVKFFYGLCINFLQEYTGDMQLS